MRICIAGFYGWGNIGDEAILQSIINELGRNHEYIVCTSLPYNYWEGYKSQIGIKCEIRLYEDLRTDFDAFVLGGGDLNFGYGWRQCLSVFANKLEKNIKCMNYAVGYNKRWYYSPRLHKLYYEFLKNFDRITVRDEGSFGLLKDIGLNNHNVITTFDPAILLDDKKGEFDSCPICKTIVFPRYEDYGMGSNDEQIEWLVNELRDICLENKDVILVACSPRNIEGVNVDIALCIEIQKRLKGSQIIEISPFEPEKLKYLIGQSSMVYSGGRYHPIVFAISKGIPFKMYPGGLLYAKNASLIDMYMKYGKDGLIELAKKNKEIFFDMLKRY
jgi:polysaccharide pyruvyl transferase WcaK-like protein